ncbi:hypothetical protein FHS95_002407 [Sphingomonas naasensis]|uniref:TonB C-terminal domain-containing protein n=1 Tax=Sphingomonas naasensis TaxID=1344951 RepID=A0A4S1WMN8_9SPHN|nr:energy transducer TonB [Sphingomonas naasensis]NIJ20715.1 hypothetical protein [Sphingomonas naasensis]TGX43130.1 hypothetical protein E5A74_08080 [Sphingomonas naasensis]
MTKWIWALLALAVSGTAAAKDREPEVLTLSSKWIARYETDACNLVAQFGTGDRAMIAMLTRYQPGDDFDLTLIGKQVRYPEASVDAKVDFGIQADARRSVMLGNMGERPAMFFKSLRLDGWQWKENQLPPRVTPEQEKGVVGVTVSIAAKTPLRLVTKSGLAKPMAALRTCMDDLIKSWGYDPAEQAALSKPAMPLSPPPSWFHSDDYPLSAMRGGHNGHVQFRLDIDPTGKIAGCHVLARTNPDDFADLTCKLIQKRGGFSPALDAAGKPVRSYFIKAVRFMIGG